MSATLNEFAPGLGATIPTMSLMEKNSRKLFGYDFVNYRSDCETSNANGLLKYNDVVNFGRRISDANVHNCVMCGEFDVVIPTQNKDVCKGCDSSFWYNSKLNVSFKFCKGCKNFVTLEMFSDKPDASKCCRCRRRGRENYLTKKFIGSQDMCSTPGYTTDSPPNVSPALSADSAEDTLASFKNAASNSTPAACTPASILRSFHTIPYSGSDGSCPSSAQAIEVAARVTKPYKKRSISADHSNTSTSAAEEFAFYAGMPAKPPKNPRSVSYSTDMPRAAVTPSWAGNLTQLTPLSMLNTPSGKKASTVTPASYLALEGSSSSGSAGRMVRFARSNSVCSADGAYTETDEGLDQSQYLWDRSSCGQSSPQASNTPTPIPLNYFVSYTSHTPGAVTRQQELNPDPAVRLTYAHSGDLADPAGSNKENSFHADKAIELDAICLLRNSCARLFSDAVEEVPVVSPAVSEAPDFYRDSFHDLTQGSSQDSTSSDKFVLNTPGSHCKDLRRLHSTESTFSPPLTTLPAELAPEDHMYVPSFATLAPNAITGTESSVRPDAGLSQEGQQLLLSPASSRRRQWEWDPCLNPLMHLAMITERI